MSYQPTICIVTPTIGRPTLKNTLESGVIGLRDRWVIASDGVIPQARDIWEETIQPGSGILFVESKTHRGDHGNPLRDEVMRQSEEDYFIFLDDDDVLAPGGIKIIKREIKQHYPRPIMFKMRNGNGEILWNRREVEAGNVGGSMFCVPNHSARLGTWANGHGHRSDYEFIRSTLEKYGPGWRKHLIWAGDIIIICKPGEQKNGE